MPKYRIHIGSDIILYPEDIEISAAMILAESLKTDITFVKRSSAAHTADFLINSAIWEHKAPRGSGKHTIQNNLREADNQSCNVIIDLRRCKLHPQKAISNIRHEISKANKIKRLMVITKGKKILVIK